MQIGPRIRFDSHTLGNFVKNASPVAGAVIGGPLGLLAAGGLSAAGDLGRGKSLGQALPGAIENAGLAYGGQQIAGHFGYGGLTGGGGAAPAAATPAPSPSVGGVPHGGLALPSTPNLTQIATPPVDPRSTLEKLGSGIGNVADFAGSHDKTTAAALGAVGNLATAGTQQRIGSAQARLLDIEAMQKQQEIDRQKAQDQAMEPLRQAIYGKLATTSGIGTPGSLPGSP